MPAFTPTKFGDPSQILGEFHAVHVDLINFDEVSARLAVLSTYLEEKQLPLRGVQRIAQQDIKERFETETAPDGSQWFDLDPDYAKKKVAKVGFDHPILTREGELKRKATSKDAFTVTGDSIWYNTSDLPEYWRVHQEGSEDFGAAFHATANIEGESDVEGLQNIPPRPYIGLSAKAEGQVLELFDIWLSNGLEMATRSFAISSAGTLHERTPTGTFGERILF